MNTPLHLQHTQPVQYTTNPSILNNFLLQFLLLEIYKLSDKQYNSADAENGPNILEDRRYRFVQLFFQF
jgi:hypothetical protein